MRHELLLVALVFHVIVPAVESNAAGRIGGGAKTLWVIVVIIIPLLGILIYLIARGHGMQERQIEQAKEMQQAQAEYIQSVAGSGNSADQIASAKKLLDEGTISQAEFDQIKSKALAS